MRLLRGSLICCALLFFAGSSPLAYAQEREPASCAAAAQLVEENFPARALAVIDAAQLASLDQVPLCFTAKQAAAARIQASFVSSQQSHELISAKKWGEALQAAEKALAENADNLSAKTARDLARAASEKSPAQARLDEWKSITERHFTPLAGLLLPLAVVFGVLLAASRLLPVIVHKWPVLEDQKAKGGPRLVLLLGLLQIVFSSVLFTVGLTSILQDTLWLLAGILLITLIVTSYSWNRYSDNVEGLPKASTQFAGTFLLLVALISAILGSFAVWIPDELLTFCTVVAAALAGFIGAFLTAWWLATRLRMEVRVRNDGKAKPDDEGLVVALLSELGVQKPQGIEVPRGGDVTALDGALATMPENPVTKLIKSALAVLLGSTPWVATVEGGPEGRTLSMSRNGRVVESMTIEKPDAISPPKATGGSEGAPTAETAVVHLSMVAAAILMVLSREHPSLKPGLAGATDWRSVGLQYIATTALNDDLSSEQRKIVLARAMKHDPDNLAASLAFRHTLDRKAKEAQPLIAYRNWLESFEKSLCDKRLGQSALRLRASYTRTIVAINAVFGSGPAQEVASKRVENAQHALANLRRLFEEFRAIDDLSDLIAVTEDNIIGLELLILDLPEDKGADSPNGAYNRACYYASKGDWKRAEVEDAIYWPPIDSSMLANDNQKAVALFRIAAADPELADWMREDPQLATFRTSGEYKAAFLKEPRSDFYALDPIQPFAKLLRAAGYGQFELLARLPSESALAHIIPADAVVRGAMLELARLRCRFTEELAEQDWAVELLGCLVSLGLANVKALRSLPIKQKSKVASLVANSIERTFRTKGDVRKPIEFWLIGLEEDSSPRGLHLPHEHMI
jgi:hypothetical protein